MPEFDWIGFCIQFDVLVLLLLCNSGQTNTQGLKNNWGESAAFAMTSSNG